MENEAKKIQGQRQLRRLVVLMDVVFALVIFQIFLLLPRPTPDQLSLKTLGAFFQASNIDLGVLVTVLVGIAFTLIYWMQNNKLLSNLTHTDNKHSAYSILQLFLLLFYFYSVRLGIDFPGDKYALVLQSVMLVLVGVAASLGWSYAIKGRRLLGPELSDEAARKTQITILAEPITALIALPCAFIGPIIWEVAWLTYPVIKKVLDKRMPGN